MLLIMCAATRISKAPPGRRGNAAPWYATAPGGSIGRKRYPQHERIGSEIEATVGLIAVQHAQESKTAVLVRAFLDPQELPLQLRPDGTEVDAGMEGTNEEFIVAELPHQRRTDRLRMAHWGAVACPDSIGDERVPRAEMQRLRESALFFAGGLQPAFEVQAREFRRHRCEQAVQRLEWGDEFLRARPRPWRQGFLMGTRGIGIDRRAREVDPERSEAYCSVPEHEEQESRTASGFRHEQRVVGAAVQIELLAVGRQIRRVDVWAQQVQCRCIELPDRNHVVDRTPALVAARRAGLDWIAQRR